MLDGAAVQAHLQAEVEANWPRGKAAGLAAAAASVPVSVAVAAVAKTKPALYAALTGPGLPSDPLRAAEQGGLPIDLAVAGRQASAEGCLVGAAGIANGWEGG